MRALSESGIVRPTLHLIPGISASGKTTLGRRIVARLNAEKVPAKLVVPHTTRPKRSYESAGVDYHFHSRKEFEEIYRALCEDPSNEWAASEIVGHYYFNTLSATRPTPDCPVSILPVAFDALNDVIEEHQANDYALTALPVAINDTLRDRWLTLVQPQRPTRYLESELAQQDLFLSNYNSAVFYPQWEVDLDSDAYYSEVSALIGRCAVINK